MVPLPSFAHVACEQSLTSSALELKYARSAHLVDIISKDEDIRRLRFDVHILEDDNDELRELLSQEEDRADAFERLVNENLARAEAAEAQLQELENDLRARHQELMGVLAEKQALQHSTEDATAALTEKLALTRELSLLKPELEHLKTQAANAEALTTEKLALQRQIMELQVDVEKAKREAQRALAKRRNTGVEIAQEEQMEDLRRQLKKEQRARQRAEEAADVSQADVNVDEVRKELALEKRARQKAEEQLEEAQQNTLIEDVRRDLLKEKKQKQKLEDTIAELQAELEKAKKAAARAAKRVDGNAAADDQAEELRQQLAKETKGRMQAEKAAKQAAAEFEAQKATLDDKLNQFRTKLRSTKETLKETEAELAAARTAALAVAPAKKASASISNKKRTAAHLESEESALGTPGDGPAAKRGRKAAAAVGDKSTFSITPFLNRAMSAALEGGEGWDAASDAEASPAAKKPLAVQAPSKSNVQSKKPAQRKPKAAPALEMVTEEAGEDVHSQGQENAAKAKGATMKIKTKVADGPSNDDREGAQKQKKKMRKSITEFAAFSMEPEVATKKKRKLGPLGKTLFDEEEETAPKALPGRGLFGGKGFGGFGAKKGGLGSSRVGSTLMTAMDGSGFQFSPLKRARKGLDDTLRG